MTPAAIIREAATDGVSLALSPAGTIKATGDQAAVSRWLPVFRAQARHRGGARAPRRHRAGGGASPSSNPAAGRSR
jgi:hypothetical protein